MGNSRSLGVAWALSALLFLYSETRALEIEKMYGVLSGGRAIDVVAKQALVKFDPSVTPARCHATLASVGARVISPLRSVGWVVVELPSSVSVANGCNTLKNLPGVVAVEPHHVFYPIRLPNDPQVSNQYHLSKINTFAAWDYEVGGSNLITIAVMDAGIQGTHPELQSKLVGTSQFFDPNNNGAQSSNQPPTPACNHGTQVASVAAAVTDNSSGVAGISWGAKLISLKVFSDSNCNPSGNCPSGCGTTTQAIINALDYARTTLQGAAGIGQVIVNMSLGGAMACPSAMQTAVSNAYNAGVVLVAAAGNDGADVHAPGNCIVACPNCTGVIPVGATDSNDNVASFSNRGSSLAANGVVAPGVAVVTSSLDGTVASVNGTSFSAPIVSGLAALILAAKPAFTPSQVRDTIRASADNIGVSGVLGLDSGVSPLGDISGAGRVNAYRALRLAVTGSLTDFEGERKAIAFPNPFRPSTHGTVTITIPTSIQGKNATIKIYTLDGQFIRELSGQTWDGKNASGISVATGVYLFLVKTDSGMMTGRIAVIR